MQSNKQLQEGLAEDDDDVDLSDDSDGDHEKRHGGKRKSAGGRKATGGRQAGTTPKRPRPAASSARGARKRQAPQLKVRVSGAPAAQVSSEVARARAKLHLAALPSSTEALPCREVEFYSIHEFVREKVQAGASGCMFVSGVPGTGVCEELNANHTDENESGELEFLCLHAAVSC
jgi:origin recognition complex subunit 1